jgi:hypothetical protein
MLVGGGIAVLGVIAWVVFWVTTSGEDVPPPVETAPPVAATQPMAPAAQTALPQPPASSAAAPAPAPERPAPQVAAEPPANVESKSVPRTTQPMAPRTTAKPGGETASSTSPQASDSTPPARRGADATPRAPRSDPAADALRGRFVGNYFDSAGTFGLTLVITSINDGAVEGRATLSGQGCGGDYPLRGTYRDKRLELKAPRNGGPAGDCPLGLKLSMQGEKLTGTLENGSRVELWR